MKICQLYIRNNPGKLEFRVRKILEKHQLVKRESQKTKNIITRSPREFPVDHRTTRAKVRAKSEVTQFHNDLVVSANVDEDILGLHVSVRDTFAVHEAQPFNQIPNYHRCHVSV